MESTTKNNQRFKIGDIVEFKPEEEFEEFGSAESDNFHRNNINKKTKVIEFFEDRYQENNPCLKIDIDYEDSFTFYTYRFKKYSFLKLSNFLFEI